MTDQELQKYVQDQLAQGIDPAVLRMALEAEGVSADQITQALAGKIHSPAIQVPKPQGVPAPVSTVAEPAPVIASPIAVVPTKKGFFAHKAIIISVLVILALAAGGVYAYTTLMLTPEKATEKMLTNLAEINSLDYDVSIKGTITDKSGEEPHDHSGELKFRGTSDISNPNDPKASFLVDFQVAGDFGFGFEARLLNRTGYFRINDFPEGFGLDGSKIENQWVKVDIDDIEEQTGTEADVLNNTLTAEQIQKISDAYVKYPMVKLGEKMGTETLDGTSTYHYSFTADKDNAKNFLKEVLKITYEREEEYEEYADELESSLNTLFEMVNIPGGEVWVGKKDFLPRKLNFTVNISSSENFEGTASFDFSFLFKNFNAPSPVQAPADAKEFKELYEELTGEPYVDPVVKSADAGRLADVRQLMTAMELYFNDNGMYPPVKNGRPDPEVKAAGEFGVSFKTYIATYPEYVPHSGSTACADNTAYVYSRPTPGNYSISFCLESAIGGYEAGDHTASPAGIN